MHGRVTAHACTTSQKTTVADVFVLDRSVLPESVIATRMGGVEFGRRDMA